jgi:hypothetical protein
VLEKMGEARPTSLFVLRADVIPHVHGHDGRFVIFVDYDGKPVVEHELLIGNIYLLSSSAGPYGKS